MVLTNLDQDSMPHIYIFKIYPAWKSESYAPSNLARDFSWENESFHSLITLCLLHMLMAKWHTMFSV